MTLFVVVDVSEARDDWRKVLERLELARVIEQRAGADAVVRTLEELTRWTGATTGT